MLNYQRVYLILLRTAPPQEFHTTKRTAMKPTKSMTIATELIETQTYQELQDKGIWRGNSSTKLQGYET